MPKFIKLSSGITVEESSIGSSSGVADSNKIPHLDASGRLSLSFLPTSLGSPVRVILGADITSSSTTLGDATGLSFSVISGVRYRFTFWIIFRSAATTTGIQLSINSPATSQLVYNCIIPISASTNITGYRRAVNTVTTGTGVDVINVDLLATIEGIIIPSSSGTLIARYCSEVASSAVTIKAGSHGELISII